MSIILVAEDNDSNYLLLSCILRNKYDLVRAVNGVEAVEKFKEINPDLVLMDIRMPKMDGLEATAVIREDNIEVPIVALTAHAFEEDRINAFNAGCNEFLTKPINIKNLTTVLERLIS